MVLKVRSTEFNYDMNDTLVSINIRYDGRGLDSNINGYLTISAQEYEENNTSLTALANYISSIVKDSIEVPSK